VKREDDDHKEYIGMLINLFQLKSIYFNQKNSVHTRHDIWTHSATILARQKTPDDGRTQSNHVMWKNGDYIVTECLKAE
jgi:hypothetical protein